MNNTYEELRNRLFIHNGLQQLIFRMEAELPKTADTKTIVMYTLNEVLRELEKIENDQTRSNLHQDNSKRDYLPSS